MKQFKLRAWDTVEKKMRLEALVIKNIGLGEGSVVASAEVQTDHPLIWMQFTGLKDKNDKEIYESDIIQIDYVTEVGTIKVIGKMVFDESRAQFGTEAIMEVNLGSEHIIERKPPLIIGNIYENPELLNPELLKK